jgi:hypothetical protein
MFIVNVMAALLDESAKALSQAGSAFLKKSGRIRFG